MKTLLIIRHAKAEQSFGSDKARALTERGHEDAMAMAERLLKSGYTIDKIFTSPAIRTLQTTEYFAKVHQVAIANIKIFDDLYLGDTLAITESIEWLQENIHTLAIVAHNPGVTNFTNDETGAHIENLPTCGIAVIEVGMNNWEEDFEKADKKLIAVLTPKD